MKFNRGDKVVTEDGECGIILRAFGGMDDYINYVVKIGNRTKGYLEEGLLHFEKKKPSEQELWPCQDCKEKPVLFGFNQFYYVCKCSQSSYCNSGLQAKTQWNNCYGKKPRELKKGDVVYLRVIVGEPCADHQGDIRVAYTNCLYSAERRAQNDNYHYAAADEVFTLEELQEMKDEGD